MEGTSKQIEQTPQTTKYGTFSKMYDYSDRTQSQDKGEINLCKQNFEWVK